MSDLTDRLYKIIGDHPTGPVINTNVSVDDIMSIIYDIKKLEEEVYAYTPSDPYIPDGLTWKQLYAYKEQEKKGGQPIDSYLKTLKATSDLLLEHHRQAINAMKQVMQDKEPKYIEDVWKEAMKAFMTMPESIMKGYK